MSFDDNIGTRYERTATSPEHIGNWVLTGAAPNRKLTRYDKDGQSQEWAWEHSDAEYFDAKIAEVRVKAAAKARKAAWKEFMAEHDPPFVHDSGSAPSIDFEGVYTDSTRS